MFIFYLILTFLLRYSCAEIKCRDEFGDDVDWFYLYKLPKHFDLKTSNSTDNTGLRYLYISSKNPTADWQLSKKFINDTESFPGQLINLTAQSSQSILIAYNDENPNGNVDFLNGHTKGILAADSKTGFWLIHSVPKYPNITNKYSYPKNGLHYGQSFLCLSLSADQINLVGEQLIYNEPNVYYSRFPEALANLYPNVGTVLEKKWKNVGPFWNKMELTTLGGYKFLSFAKSGKFAKELYEDWVAPVLNRDLFVETWRLGAGNLPTNCTKNNKVLNIKEIKSKDLNISFKTTSDHSKWAITADVSWICVGDINRQMHQLIRGGGTVCQRNKIISHAYGSLIAAVENCPKNKSELYTLIFNNA